MTRRNKVPDSVSAGTPQAKELEKARRNAIIAARAAEHPSMSAASDGQLAWQREHKKKMASWRPLGVDEERVWAEIPGANSVVPEVRERARSWLLPEEGQALRRAKLNQQLVEVVANSLGSTAEAGLSRGSKWFADTAERYGIRNAESARTLVGTDRFRDFMWQGKPEQVIADAKTYATVQDIVRRIGGNPEQGYGLVGGSQSINKYGTLWRPSAISHDLDFEAYLGAASKTPWAGLAAPGAKEQAVAAVRRPGAIESSPILDRIRKEFPESFANAEVRRLPWYEILNSWRSRYKPGRFQVMTRPGVTVADPGAHMFVGTEINGIPVDIFLRDSRIATVPGSKYAPAETAFAWKNYYIQNRRAQGWPVRQKDLDDIARYRPFSESNPIVDPVTRKAQFSPPNFGDRILTEEGLPVISDVPIWPGSRHTVPMMMNTKGEMIYPFDLNVLRQDAKGGDTRADAKGGKASKLSEEQRVAHVNAGIAKHPGFSEGDIEDMRKSAAFIADPKNAIRGLLVEGTLKHDAERPVFYSRNDWEGGQEGFQGDRFSMASSLDDGHVVVFPSIYADQDGVTRLHTGKDAFDHYQKTGEHFGIYDSVENANRASEWSHHAGNAGWLKRHEKQQDAKGGDASGPETAVSETPVSEGGAPAPEGGPRIVINPTTFRNKKDALCVAFNEAFRVVMEDMQFDPVSEPTDEQREFFSDTAYANDENQLRRTILARICTFDTSVKDPTDEQIQEAVEFLEYVMESGAPQNEWEQSAVQRIHDVLASVPAGQGEREEEPAAEEAPEPPADKGTVEADVGGGDADEEELRRQSAQYEAAEVPDADGRTAPLEEDIGALGGETGLGADAENDLVKQGTEFDEPATKQETVQPRTLNVQDGPARSPAEGVRAHNADYRPGVGVQDGPARSPAEGVRAHNADYRPGVGVQDGPARSPAEGVRAHASWAVKPSSQTSPRPIQAALPVGIGVDSAEGSRRPAVWNTFEGGGFASAQTKVERPAVWNTFEGGGFAGAVAGVRRPEDEM